MEPKNVERAIFEDGVHPGPRARDMADQTIADRLKALAEDYERRAEQALMTDTTDASTHPPVQPEPVEK